MAVLIGDRFARVRGDWVDLVTGETVELRLGRAPRDLEARRRQCVDASARVSADGPRLIDFGQAGEGLWFEARRVARAGLEASPLALRRLARGLDAPIMAAACEPTRRGCLHVSVVAPPRSGWRLAIDEVARAARRAGFVTLSAELALPSGIRKLLRHRHLVLLVPRPQARDAAARWAADVTDASDRAHVLIERVHVRPLPADDATLTIELQPCAVQELIDACVAHSSLDDTRIGEAAAASGGWPGCFVDGCTAQASVSSPPVLRDTACATVTASSQTSWPFSVSRMTGGPARLLDRAERCHRRGRRAEGDDWLRAGHESARRRGDVAAASRALERWVPRLIADGESARAASLATRALRGAQDPCQRAALARLAALAHLDAAHLGRAAACIETAICIEQLTERCVSPSSVAVRAALRFWQGRWADAEAELAALPRALQEDPRVMLWREWFAWASDDGSERRRMGRLPSATEDVVYRFGLQAFRAAATGLAPDVTAALVGDLGLPTHWRAVMAGQAWIECGNTAAAIDAVSCGLRPVARRGLADAVLASMRVALGVANAPEAAWAEGVVVREHLKGAVRFGQGRGAMQMFHDVATLLEAVQGSEDELAGLRQVCGWIRRAGASACAVIGAPGGRVLAGDAPDVGDAVLRDWLDRPADVIDEGPLISRVRAPIRYGGAVVGLVVAAGVPLRSRALLAAVQAAAAVCGALTRARLDAEAAGARTDDLARDILGASAAIGAVRLAVARAAVAPYPVVIEGESGTGKELVARALHRLSARRDRPFAALNCAALTDELVEAELFGHARGAFTHAVNARAGLFEEAHHGTLFLDEVGDLSPRAQAKLLRVLQEGEIRRVGENEPRAVDVRVVCATNRPLAALVAAGRFRDDLMFRLAVIRIDVPPLRDRHGDVPGLASAFWRQAARRVGTRAVLGADALTALGEWPWPGNVRELQNAMAAVAVAAPATGRVGARLVRQVLRHATTTADVAEVVPLEAARREVERRMVSAALARHTGSRAAAAHALGLSRQGLSKAMRRLGLAEAGVA